MKKQLLPPQSPPYIGMITSSTLKQEERDENSNNKQVIPSHPPAYLALNVLWFHHRRYTCSFLAHPPTAFIITPLQIDMRKKKFSTFVSPLRPEHHHQQHSTPGSPMRAVSSPCALFHTRNPSSSFPSLGTSPLTTHPTTSFPFNTTLSPTHTYTHYQHTVTPLYRTTIPITSTEHNFMALFPSPTPCAHPFLPHTPFSPTHIHIPLYLF